MGAISDYLKRLWGVGTRPRVNPLVSASINGVVQVLRNNPDRFMWTFFNLSDTDMYIGFDNVVSATYGMLVAKSGGSIGLTASEDGELVCEELYVYCTAVKSLYTIETLAV